MHQIQKIFSYARILHPLKANLPTLSLSPGINIQIAPKYTAFFSTKQPELQIIKNENVKGLIHPTEETKIPYCNYYNLSSPKPKPVLLKYKLAKLKYSRWKLNDHAKLIRRLHIWDAELELSKLKTKGARMAIECLNAAVQKAVITEHSAARLFISQAFVGHKHRTRRIDIKAKGMFGIQKRNLSELTIILEEKSVEEMYKMFMTGDCPNGIAFHIRKFLFQNNADYFTLRKFGHMTTSKGRMLRKEQFRRLVDHVYQEFESEGKYISKMRIEEYLLATAADRFSLETQSMNKEMEENHSEIRLGTLEENIQNKKAREKEEEKIWRDLDAKKNKEVHERKMKKKGLRSMLTDKGKMVGLRRLFQMKGKDKMEDDK